MKIEKCEIEDVLLYEMETFPDTRGSFFELFRREWLPEIFGEKIQINCSHSNSGVLRGLHYHKNQWDFWVPLNGRMTAGLADLRAASKTRHKSLSLELDSETPRGLLIPPGVAHGFAAITDLTLVYVVSNYFDGSDEHGVAWNDPGLSIDWKVGDPVISERDRHNRSFNRD